MKRWEYFNHLLQEHKSLADQAFEIYALKLKGTRANIDLYRAIVYLLSEEIGGDNEK